MATFADQVLMLIDDWLNDGGDPRAMAEQLVELRTRLIMLADRLDEEPELPDTKSIVKAVQDEGIRWRKTVREAEAMHAWLLRAEGLTQREIGERLGRGNEQARQRIAEFGRKMRWATRRMRVTVTHG